MASPTTTPQTDPEHEAEVAQQEEIAQEVASAHVPQTPPAPEEATKVKLKPSDAVESYPLTVSAVGTSDIVFESAASTVAVVPEVAEQIKFLPTVEVAA